MLILRRREGQWVTVTHSQSGDTIRICVNTIRKRIKGQVDLAFDDQPRNFQVTREERKPTGSRDPEVDKPETLES